MSDVPDLSSDEECLEDDEWEEMETSESSVVCLFCEDSFPNVDKGFEHCKKKHDFDISALKTKHCMDFYSYIKLITYIRTTNAEAASIMSASNCLWADEAYLKPLKNEDWLMYDFDSINVPDSPDTVFHANVENGLVTLSEAHFAELQRTIQSLTAQLRESHNLLALTKSDMEVMKNSVQNILSDSGGDGGSTSQSTVMDCVGKMALEDDQGYFNTYAHFSIHHDMLSDEVRTKSYKLAILNNSGLMKGKCVLDLGCGTGILSMFAASAGARRVLAVDQSDIVYHAMDIVRENNLHDTIQIIKGRLEDTEIPEKADIIISEWMGYFLLFEGMLDSVIYARDHHLKPGGMVLPNRFNIQIVGSGDVETHSEYISFWSDVYGYKMNCMKREVVKEASIQIVKQEHLITTECVVCNIDMATCTIDTVNFTSEFDLQIKRDGSLTFLVGFFETFFDLEKMISFSTAPNAAPTHWKQTVFYFKDPISVKEGDHLTGTFSCRRNTSDIRGLAIDIVLLGKTYKYMMC